MSDTVVTPREFHLLKRLAEENAAKVNAQQELALLRRRVALDTVCRRPYGRCLRAMLATWKP